MPKEEVSKEYGPHDYGENGQFFECQRGCGCWIKSRESGGPLGIDPQGECPKNPSDGKFLGQNADQELIAARRIRSMEIRLVEADKILQNLRPNCLELAKELAHVKAQLAEARRHNDIFNQMIERPRGCLPIERCL